MSDSERLSRDDRGVSRRAALALLGAGSVVGGGALAFRRFGSTGETTVRIAEISWIDDDIEDEFERALHDAGLDENVSVELRGPKGSLEPRQNKYVSLIDAGRERPTILRMSSRILQPFVQRDMLTNLDAIAPDSALAAVQEEYVDPLVMPATGSDGSLYAQPLFLDVSTIQYRKDLFRQAGYDDSAFRTWATDPPTWQEFADVVRAVRDDTDAEHGFTFQAASYRGLSCCTFPEFMSSWGGAYFGNPEQYLFGPVGDRPITVDEQPVLDAIRMMRAFVHGTEASNALDNYPAVAPEAVLEWSEESSREPFTGGEVVAHRNWAYSVATNAREEHFGSDLGTMPLPYAVSESEARYPMTGGTVVALGGEYVALNPHASDRRTRAAIDVLEAMQQPSFQRWALRTLEWLPPRRSLFDDPEFASIEPLGPHLETLGVAAENAIPQPVSPVWPDESPAIAEQVHAALTGETSPERAMTALKEQLREIEQLD